MACPHVFTQSGLFTRGEFDRAGDGIAPVLALGRGGNTTDGGHEGAIGPGQLRIIRQAAIQNDRQRAQRLFLMPLRFGNTYLVQRRLTQCTTQKRRGDDSGFVAKCGQERLRGLDHALATFQRRRAQDVVAPDLVAHLASVDDDRCTSVGNRILVSGEKFR
jgi:hypothetical protein